MYLAEKLIFQSTNLFFRLILKRQTLRQRVACGVFWKVVSDTTGQGTREAEEARMQIHLRLHSVSGETMELGIS